MRYRHAEKAGESLFASGGALYGGKGLANFPVRLAREILARCIGYLNNKKGIIVYDPCCGGGYLLTVLGFHFPGNIKKLIGSDIDGSALRKASGNLSLLSREGLERRLSELDGYYLRFGKESHLRAAESVRELIGVVEGDGFGIETTLFNADILAEDALSGETFSADVVITDVPYGNLTEWRSETCDIWQRLFANLSRVASDSSVVAICSDNRAKITASGFERLEKNIVGKRKFEIYKKPAAE